jgi:hypothetical protein
MFSFHGSHGSELTNHPIANTASYKKKNVRLALALAEEGVACRIPACSHVSIYGSWTCLWTHQKKGEAANNSTPYQGPTSSHSVQPEDSYEGEDPVGICEACSNMK